MDHSQLIGRILDESAAVKRATAETRSKEIGAAAILLAGTFRSGRKMLICGNGGSAADSQHIATELVVRLSSRLERNALPAMALTTNSSTITAGANDYGFEHIFSRQVEAFGEKDDLLIGISTSGNSANVIAALETARKKRMKCISLLGGDGGKMKGMADIDIIVPHSDTGRIQETHITIGHILCDIVERELFGYTDESK